MTEQECFAKMVAPGTHRPGKYREGVIQILVTRTCDKACFNCTQGSNHSGPPRFMSPDNFRLACRSLRGYFGVVGMFGGNPALHPQFGALCEIMREEVPANQRGLWCNNPITVERAKDMRRTFDPAISNLNVHLDQKAYDLFKTGWPECSPVGLTQDSRHSPGWVAMKDVVKESCKECDGSGFFSFTSLGTLGDGQRCGACDGSGFASDESRIWELISDCDINKHWSAMIGEFRGQLRAWFCEIAGAQAIKHQDEPDYPDTGLNPEKVWAVPDRIEDARWWELGMDQFQTQVRKHCFDCGVPLRGYGELAMATDKPWVDDATDPLGAMAEILDETPTPKEQVSETHADACKPKRAGRAVEMVTQLEQLGIGRLQTTTKYLQNSKL